MKITLIRKAEQSIGHRVEDQQIMITMAGHEPLRNSRDKKAEQSTCERDGAQLAEILFSALPGATLDQMLATLADMRRSKFVVSYDLVMSQYKPHRRDKVDRTTRKLKRA